MNVENKLKVLDLFCGCGGMTKGLIDAGLDVIAGIDIWNKAIDSYKCNYNHLAICEDLTKLSPYDFKIKYNINDNIDLIVGGPPCQSYSTAGKRDKNDPRGSLFMEYCKYLDFFKPKAFIMENVIGILSAKTNNDEKIINIIMEKLNKNYNCKINKLYASDFGVPQNRRRTIIIGIRKDLNIIPEEIKPILTKDKRIPVKTILKNKNDIDNKYFLSEKTIERNNNKKSYKVQFLNPEKPSYTILASYHKDGKCALVKYDDNTIRKLTIPELKKIQSFPDDYILKGSDKNIMIQIGNAVPCVLAKYLGLYIKKLLTYTIIENHF
jgi:DNA (cytosine-5)-methyltransferase 1